jgi:hypothetical protein
MGYRNKTYVAFASEDIRSYYLMRAWRQSAHIEFDFHDAHDINIARDTSLPETIRRRLAERLSNTKQSIVLVSPSARVKSQRAGSFFYYEVEAIARLGLPVVFANLNQSRTIQESLLPTKLGSPYYTISTSFQPAIIKFALDGYVPFFNNNPASRRTIGPHYYTADKYARLGL